MSVSKSLMVAVSAVAGVVAAVLVWWFIGQGRSAAEVTAGLPDRPGATLYIDVRMIRAAGLMKHFSAPAAAQDPDYREFVAATGFDYTRDLDCVAVRFTEGGEVWISAAGRFDHGRLAAYAAARGGRCVRGLCSMPGSTPGRNISWIESDGRTLNMAVSADPLAAALSGSGRPPREKLPASPVWLHLPAAQLKAAEGLPPGASALFSALEGAKEAVFWAGAGRSGVTIELEAPFSSPAEAEASASRLTEATAMFNKLLARSDAKEKASGLGAVLASGQFRREASSARGVWLASSTVLDELVR